MRHSFNHVVTALLLEVVGEDALLNETVAEIERRALEERRTSPRYSRGKELRRRGYARYRFLKGFKVSLLGVVYGLEWVTVSLPVLYRGGERVRTRVEEELLREERLVLRSLLLLYSVLGGKLNAKLWTQEPEVRGGLQVRGRGREVREVEGREEGGPLNRVGTHRPRCEGRAGRGPDQGGGRRELLGPPGEAVEEVQPHPGRSRRGEGPRRGHLPLQDQGREADLPGPPQTKREGEGLAGPPPLPRRVRPHPWLPPPLLPPRPQGGPSSGHLAESFNSILESSASATPPGGPDRPGHSPQLQPLDLSSHSCNNITRTLISS